jgi:hypothetical protein
VSGNIEQLDAATINQLVDVARNLKPAIRPSVYRGKEYYWLSVGREQAGNVIRGEVAALQPVHVEADVREDGSWTVVVLDSDGDPLLFCHPDFFCEMRGCTINELLKLVGMESV